MEESDMDLKERALKAHEQWGGKIEVVLENGERLMVSRQYVPMLKEKLGL